jgi:hypothetical protein
MNREVGEQIADEEREEALTAEARSRNGRRSRTKGRAFERLVAKMLREVWPDAKRGFQSRSGRDAPDVDGTELWIETKHGARVNVRAAMRQALAATDGRPVVVVSREDRSEVLVTMRFEDWLAREQAIVGLVADRDALLSDSGKCQSCRESPCAGDWGCP